MRATTRCCNTGALLVNRLVMCSPGRSSGGSWYTCRNQHVPSHVAGRVVVYRLASPGILMCSNLVPIVFTFRKRLSSATTRFRILLPLARRIESSIDAHLTTYWFRKLCVPVMTCRVSFRINLSAAHISRAATLLTWVSIFRMRSGACNCRKPQSRVGAEGL